MSELKLRITQYGKQIDELMDSAEIDKLEEFLTELEKFIGETGNDYPEIYYYLGTGYGVYSSLLIRNDWTLEQNPKVEESNAVALFREQARMLGIRTKNRVKASFAKTGKVQIPEGLETFVEGTRAIVNAIVKTEDELEGKEDIGLQYFATGYRFEIYNNDYRFRVFELIDKTLFPITIICDSDIADQIGSGSEISIRSNKELEKVAAEILNSVKVKSVISKMTENEGKG